MKKKAIMISLLVALLFVSSCFHQTVTCSEPYILVGDDCCVDLNDNSVCDDDEDVIAGDTTPDDEDGSDLGDLSDLDNLGQQCDNKGNGETTIVPITIDGIELDRQISNSNPVSLTINAMQSKITVSRGTEVVKMVVNGDQNTIKYSAESDPEITNNGMENRIETY